MEVNKWNELLKVICDSLTDEQKAQAKGFKTMEDLVLFAGREGIEIPDELLDAVAGGGDGDGNGNGEIPFQSILESLLGPELTGKKIAPPTNFF